MSPDNINHREELSEDCHLEAEKLLRDRNLGQNDRLAVELLKFAPVPEWFLSKWVPAERLLAGLRHEYLPVRWRIQFLERLAREPSLEARLQAAESPDTPVSALEELAGDVELPVRLAVRHNPNCPREAIALAEAQQAIASDWDTDPQQLAELGESRWSWVRRAVAGNPFSPPEVLEKLAQGNCYPVQLAVARNPSTPTAALEKLIKIDEQSIWYALAEHPNASEKMLLELFPDCKDRLKKRDNLPASILEQLAEDPEYFCFISDNPNATEAILERLLEDAEEYLLREVALNPQASASILERLAGNSDAEVRLAVAENLNAPLERLAGDSDAEVRLAVAGNPNAPEKLRTRLLEELAAGSDVEVRTQMARDPQTPIYLLEKLAPEVTYDGMWTRVEEYLGRTPPSLRQSIEELLAISSSASHLIFWLQQDKAFREPILRAWERVAEQMSEEQLQKLERVPGLIRGRLLGKRPELLPLYGLLTLLSKILEGEEISILKALAGNPRTPAKILESLGQIYPHSDFGNSILVALAKNPSAPAKVLETLGRLDRESYRDNWRVIIALADNPAVPEGQRLEYLEEAIACDRRGIYEAIAKNPNTPIFILERLAELAPGLVPDVATNPNAPVSILKLAARSTENWVLENVAENPNTPPDILAKLALKGESGVREAVLKHPALDSLAVYRIQLQLEEREKNKEAYEAMARRRDSPWALAEVAESGVREARSLVASNSKTPLSALEQLLKDPKISVRAALAKNSSLPLNWRLQLTRDPSVSVRIALAEERSGQQTPVEVLEALAADESENVRVLVAQNRETPSSVLENLADDESQKVRRAVARNLNTPAPVLKKIARNNPELKEAMLYREPSGNEESDRFLVELIEEFASSDDDSIRYCIADHPNAPPGVLERLLFDEYSLVRETAAANDSTPPQILREMTKENDCFYTLAKNVAMQSNAPPEILDFIAREAVASTRREAASNPNMSAETLAWLAANECDRGVLCAVAARENLPADVAVRLSRHESPLVRGWLAASSSVSVSLLEMFALDESPEVRQRLGTNSIAPVSLLEMLAIDSAAEVRAAVAANSSTPRNILERLAEDEKVEVRRAVAENPFTPTPIRESLQDLLPQPLEPKLSPTLRGLGQLYDPKTDDLPSLLSEYAQSSVAFVRFVALMHPLTPAEALAEASESVCWWERYAVACNPATPAEIRERLAGDSNSIVRATATINN